jgi:hypothetical protein
MGFWDRYGYWIVAGVIALAILAVVYLFLTGGMHRDGKKVKRPSKKPLDPATQVESLLAGQRAKGVGLKVICHDLDGEPGDITDDEIKIKVEGVLGKQPPFTQHLILSSADSLPSDEPLPPPGKYGTVKRPATG